MVNDFVHGPVIHYEGTHKEKTMIEALVITGTLLKRFRVAGVVLVAGVFCLDRKSVV